ncbi:MAG: glycosyltransferase family 4 protein [Coriobacteriaceae bacterium]|nr:glycosyltransferase family 4 protein [Coriobacteriaceae bacterium]
MVASRRIAVFSANYLPSLGGVEVYTNGLAHELARQGHQVTIVTNDVSNLGPRAVERNGVRIVRLPCFPLLNGRLPLPRLSHLRKALWAELSVEKYDGVLVNTRFYPHSLSGVRFAEMKGLHAVVLDHGSAYLTFGSALLDLAVRAWEHGMTALVKSKKVSFWGISQSSVRWLETFGIRAHGVLPNAIDADGFRGQSSNRDFRKELGIGSGPFVMCFAGRLVPEKGIDALLQAMDALDGRPVHLIIAGDGPLKREVERKRSDHVSYVGRLQRPDLAALFDQCDVLCLPTRSEGFSTTLLEAASCGTPALITHVGGVDELIPSAEFGTVLRSASSNEIALQVLRLCENRSLLKRQAENVSKRVRHEYSWNQAAAKVLSAMHLV